MSVRRPSDLPRFIKVALAVSGLLVAGAALLLLGAALAGVLILSSH